MIFNHILRADVPYILVSRLPWEYKNVGDISAVKMMQNPKSKPFLIGTNLKILKLLFNQMSPTFLYLGNPEDSEMVWGIIFALKISMQNPNIETVFKSEQI